MNCDKCKKKDSQGIYTHFSGKGFLCSGCQPSAVSSYNAYQGSLSDRVWLPDYGYTTKGEIAQLRSRKILPYEHPVPGSYYVGTKLRNGKILEKTPEL